MGWWGSVQLSGMYSAGVVLSVGFNPKCSCSAAAAHTPGLGLFGECLVSEGLGWCYVRDPLIAGARDLRQLCSRKRSVMILDPEVIGG